VGGECNYRWGLIFSGVRGILLPACPAGRLCLSPSLSPPSPPLSALAPINKIDNSNNYSDKLKNTELLPQYRNRARYPAACRSYPRHQALSFNPTCPPHPPQPQRLCPRDRCHDAHDAQRPQQPRNLGTSALVIAATTLTTPTILTIHAPGR
jgi:hypothetical protein